MKIQFSLRALFLFVVSIGLVFSALGAYRNYFKPTASSTTASVANRMMWSEFQIPDSATDVSYHVDSSGCEAEFSITEQDFLAWSNAKDWEVVEITTPVPYFHPVLMASDERPVNRGYTFSFRDGEGVFDGRRSRAAFYASTFP